MTGSKDFISDRKYRYSSEHSFYYVENRTHWQGVSIGVSIRWTTLTFNAKGKTKHVYFQNITVCLNGINDDKELAE